MLELNYQTIKEYYLANIWTAEDVKRAYLYGYITSTECDEIISLGAING